MGKERISRRKITSGDITRVIELYAAGRTYNEISQTLGIARGSVSNALRYGGIEPDRKRTEPLPQKNGCRACVREMPAEYIDHRGEVLPVLWVGCALGAGEMCGRPDIRTWYSIGFAHSCRTEGSFHECPTGCRSSADCG